MHEKVFSDDFVSQKPHILIEQGSIDHVAALISDQVSPEAIQKGDAFANEMEEKFVSDFEKSEKLFSEGKVDVKDCMAHVSTFIVDRGIVYMTYYANTKEHAEDPNNQTARLVYCPVDNPDDKVFLDIQSAGDACGGKTINMVYDTILMRKDEDTLYILWTARVEENYYRFYRPFTISTKTLGEVRVNRFKVGEITNDFSASGMRNALAENGIGYKNMYSDIGIMQKLSSRVENGVTYYYTGAYSGEFTCIIKSADLVTWEYVSQPDFPTYSEWENATYVIGDQCFYFVRQLGKMANTGFLTVYDLEKKTWQTPVLIEDCQSRADFIVYEGELYLFHAPIDRDHIGIVKIDTENIANSRVLLQAHMHTSCFYPFVQYYEDGELAMSYTVSRKHIRLGRFTLSRYLD